jgi:hypothetical protein
LHLFKQSECISILLLFQRLKADVEDYLDRMWRVAADNRAELMEFIGLYGSLNVEQLITIQYNLFCGFWDDVHRFLDTVQDRGENEMTRSTEFIAEYLRNARVAS